MKTPTSKVPCGRALFALAFLFWLVTPGDAPADRVVNANEPVIISNDITNRTTEVRSAESDGPEGGEADAGDAGDLVPDAPAFDDAPSSPADDDAGEPDDAVAEPVKDNHGHGNNEDGVDSSNPGQGGGGPNGMVDESCSGSGPCVDDESKGGGSAKSKKK